MKKIFMSLIACALCIVSAQAQEVLYLNGDVVPLKDVVRMTTRRVKRSDFRQLLEKDQSIAIYTEALNATGIMDTLSLYVDMTYKWNSEQDRIDSCTWTNDKLCIPVAKDANGAGGEYDNVAYPEKRYYNWTVFMCPDSVLEQKYGVTKVLGRDDATSLEYLAHTIYDPMYPEDAAVNELTDRRNALNRFISYHVLNRYGTYYTLTSMDGDALPNNFNRRKYDIRDYYETLMPHSLMKFSFPSGSEVGLYINRRGVQSSVDEYGVFVRGTKVLNSSDFPDVQFNATNGIYHYIDDIATYGQTTQEVVLNENIRMDCTTLSPDFMTRLTDGQTPRGHYWRDGQRYSSAVNTSAAANNPNRSVGFKQGYARNMEWDSETHMHVRGRSLWFWAYEGDEVIIKGRYDVKVKLPSVPAGTYEVRMFMCTGFATRGIVASYIDDVPQNITDFRPGGQTLFGFKSDYDLGDAESREAFDNRARKRGWMKGPDCYMPGHRSSFDASANTMRNLNNTVRRVIGTFTTDGKSDHYLRLRQLMESYNSELNFDFIELVPSSIYDNDYYPESKW